MRKTLLMFAVLLSAGTLARGVQPGEWQHHSEADFQPARREGTVIDSHGDVLLARQVKVLLASEDAPGVISAVAQRDEAVFAASGVDGRVFRISPRGEVEVFTTLPGGVVTCMTFHGKVLLVGTGGEQAGLYRIDGDGKVEAVFTHEDVTYVWDIAVVDGGKTTYLATGPKARVYDVDPQGKAQVVLDAGTLVKNMLCLAFDGQATLFVGTDEKGLVFSYDRTTGEGRVILDAAENEIASLLPDGEGGLYVATSDAAKAKGEAVTGGKTGRADDTPDVLEPAEAVEPEPTPDPVPEADTEPDASEAGDEADDVVPPVPADNGEAPADGEASDVQPETPKPQPAQNDAAKSADNGQTQSDSGKAAPAPAPVGNGKGNAVYHIDPAGYVQTVFRQPVIIHNMIAHGNRLVLATGNDGRVYYVTTDGTLRGELVDTQARQITCLLATPEGGVLFGTANAGSVGRIAPQFVREGTLVSEPLDAGQIARWGTLRLRGQAPDGTTLSIATRSGNLAAATDTTWSDWSQDQPLSDDFVQIGSPAARFLQYRITMTSVGQASASLGSVQMIYQVGNLPPAVTALEIEASDKGSTPKQSGETLRYRHVKITAVDANKDKLTFRIAYRRIGRDVWVEIAEDLNEPKFAWDTRAVADGRYELRVTASDQSSNVAPQARTGSRISEPFTVDNTPPAIQDLDLAVKAGVVTVTGKAVDATSRIKALAYSVDSAETWHVVLPVDGICDSTSESVRFEIKDLDAGPHEVSVRAVDVYDNTVYASQQVSIPAAE